MKILYYQSNKHRGPEFQIQNTIFEKNGKNYVKKTGNDLKTTKHLNDLKQNEDLIKKYFKNFSTPTIVEIKNNEIIFDYLEENTLQRHKELALLKKVFTQVNHLFQK